MTSYTGLSSFPLDHVAVAVPSLQEACRLFRLLTGDEASPVEELEAQGVRVQFIGSLELLEPLAPDTPVGRFLERRGPALHHIAYRVPDLPGTLARLQDEGLALIDQKPRPGARGHQVAFLHPGSTGGVLVELVQSSPAHDPPEPIP
jgi:methylmalonyl-CoA/ethylmalonyl-CoA epimerase